jgi:hypothetical protein
VSEFIPTSCIMFIPNRHSARGWLSGHSAKTFLDSRLTPMCASPLRYGRVPMFGGEGIGRWLLGDCRKRYADFARTASYAE